MRGQAQPGDAAQLWPVWAEEARLHVDAMPVLAEEDLVHADYLGVKRLWAISLPHFADPAGPLRERGATPAGAATRFGALQLQAWDLHAPETTPLVLQGEEHEVDYVARRCVQVRIGSRFTVHGPAGASLLHVRAGIIGERAYDKGRAPITVSVSSEGAQLGSLPVPPTERDGTGWRRLDLTLPAMGAAAGVAASGERQFTFAIDSRDNERPFCLQAWVSK